MQRLKFKMEIRKENMTFQNQALWLILDKNKSSFSFQNPNHNDEYDINSPQYQQNSNLLK